MIYNQRKRRKKEVNLTDVMAIHRRLSPFFFSEGRGASVQELATSGLKGNLMWYRAAYLDFVY